MKCIIGKKIEMTRVFDENGNATPVTVIATSTQTVTQVRTSRKDGVSSIQVGTNGGSKHVHKAQQGHLKGLKTSATIMRDVRMTDAEKFERGDTWNCDVFEKGDKVTVTGTAKGRGFQGVVKRHGFHGSPKSHGHKDQLRMPGSIASKRQGPVAKGKRMGGHMGANQVSVRNIIVVDAKPEEGLLYLKGAVPGARGSLVLVKGMGDMDVTKAVTEQAQTVNENSEQIMTEKVTDQIVSTEQSSNVDVSESHDENNSEKNTETSN